MVRLPINRLPLARLSLSAAALGALTFGAATAHHGWSGYVETVQFDVEITEIRFQNPHDSLGGTDANGESWDLLLAPPQRNRRFGFGRDDFTLGQKVTVIGDRSEDDREAKVHQIWAGDERIYEYMYAPGVSSFDRLGRDTPTLTQQR